jgi:hypothetical protein
MILFQVHARNIKTGRLFYALPLARQPSSITGRYGF